MSSKLGKALTLVALIVATVAIGYAAWQTHHLRVAFDRMATGDEKYLTETMITLAQTESHLARVRETMELLSSAVTAEPDEKTRVGLLEKKLSSTLTPALRGVLQHELKQWAKRLQDQREKRWAAIRTSLKRELSRSGARARKQLTTALKKTQQDLANQLGALEDGLSRPSVVMREQGAVLASVEQRLAAILETNKNGRQASRRQIELSDKRWEELLLALQESREATRQRYAEGAARLDQWQKDFKKSPRTTGKAQQRQRVPRDEVHRSDRQRLSELCAEDRQNPLCRSF